MNASLCTTLVCESHLRPHSSRFSFANFTIARHCDLQFFLTLKSALTRRVDNSRHHWTPVFGSTLTAGLFGAYVYSTDLFGVLSHFAVHPFFVHFAGNRILISPFSKSCLRRADKMASDSVCYTLINVQNDETINELSLRNDLGTYLDPCNIISMYFVHCTIKTDLSCFPPLAMQKKDRSR